MLASPIIVILLGIVAGIIPGLFGGGGGWLLVPILVLLIGDAGWAYAPGTVLCAYLAGVAAGVVGVRLAGPHESKVDTPAEGKVTLVMTAAGVVGAVLGKAVLRDWLVGFDSATLFLDGILVAALLLIAWRMLYEVYSRNYKEGQPLAPRGGRLVVIGLVSLVPGVLSGLIGIGGGILYVPILMVALRWRPDEARDAARICVLASSLVAASLYALSGGVHFATALGMFIPAGIVGVVFSVIRFGHSERRRRVFKLLAGSMALLAIVLAVIHMIAAGGGHATPTGTGSLAMLALILYVPLSWGVLCALGQHSLFRKLWPGKAEEERATWFYQI